MLPFKRGLYRLRGMRQTCQHHAEVVQELQAALAGPCSINAPLPGLCRVSLPACDLADLAPGEPGDLGEAMHWASCLLRSISTCSNTSATT